MPQHFLPSFRFIHTLKQHYSIGVTVTCYSVPVPPILAQRTYLKQSWVDHAIGGVGVGVLKVDTVYFIYFKLALSTWAAYFRPITSLSH